MLEATAEGLRGHTSWRWLRIAIGAAVIASLCAVPLVWLRASGAPDGAQGSSSAASLWQYYTGRPRTLWLRFPQPTNLSVGDPLFVHEQGPEQPIFLRRVGEITALHDASGLVRARRADVTLAQALVYPSAPTLGPTSQVTFRTKPQSVAWVIGALVPPERKMRIMQEIEAAAAAHREELVAALRPVAQRLLDQSLAVLQRDVPASLDRHAAEFEAVGRKYRRELLDAKVVPLMKEVVLPSLVTRVDPIARKVGRELWRRISLWSFGWRFAYDALPLTNENLADREWARFVEQDALPVLAEHTDAFVEVLDQVLTDVSRNPRVEEAARHMLSELATDPQLHTLVGIVLRETIFENDSLREAVDHELADPRTRAALQLASTRIEPLVRRIGDMVFGTQSAGITPEFAEVLRTEILYKDRRWLLVEPGDVSSGKTDRSPLSIDVRFPNP